MATNVVSVGSEILLSIKRIGINGEGIGYYKRLAIFVNDCIPGEDCVVLITEVYDQYAKGVLVNVKGKQSEFRVKPFCPHYDICGGCQLQHISYQGQLDTKQALVVEAFNRYYDGVIKPNTYREIIKAEHTTRYRSKAKLPVRYDGQSLVTGLYAIKTNKLVYIEDCLIEKEEVRKAVKDILAYLTKYQVIAYNPKLRDGVLRHIIVRHSSLSNELQVTLILYKDDERTKKIASGLTNVKNVASVYISINSDLEAIENFGDKVELVAGKPTILESINNYKFAMLPNTFFHLNNEQASVLYNVIEKYCYIKGYENVLDAYCGVGPIGIMLASKVKEVRGIDSDKEAIELANTNASINNIKNISFASTDITTTLSKWYKKDWSPDIVIVDPPRNGLDLKLIKYLQDHPVKKIVYVSCNPSTLAKNVNHLQKKYHVSFIQPIDLFPNTSNVECVVVLDRR